MVELKTLKDFEIEYSIQYFELRQEVIKWIKIRIKNCDYACRNNVIRCKEHKFWMERFNITEEDLK